MTQEETPREGGHEKPKALDGKSEKGKPGHKRVVGRKKRKERGKKRILHHWRGLIKDNRSDSKGVKSRKF